ncbi:MAG: hypothetical protein RBS99_00010 [Rhodospirillales bacterium]|nr:hypothetical protein [Rhodospirillales bacterium]
MIEKAICGDPEINDADERLAILYKKAFSSLDAAEIEKEQKEWLQVRNRCEDAACILSLYRDRILTLSATLEPLPNPGTLPVLTIPALKGEIELFESREALASVAGSIEFGHDGAGGKYVFVDSHGGMLTLGYSWDLSDKEQEVFGSLEDERTLVQVSGLLKIFDDGAASFSRAAPINIYQIAATSPPPLSTLSQSAVPTQLEPELKQHSPQTLPPPSSQPDAWSRWSVRDQNSYEHLIQDVTGGNANAQYNFGLLYDSEDRSYRSEVFDATPSGLGLGPDDTIAAAWYQKAVDQGHKKAQFKLCRMYFDGRGVPKDVNEAEALCHKAAEQYVDGANELLIKIKAEQGDQSSKERIGISYYNSRQYEKALSLFSKLGDQGNSKAQYYLGLMHENGYGLPKDFAKAADWYRKSASQGYAPAQECLGDLYLVGKGLPQDNNMAAKWYRKAAEQGIHRAKVIYKEIKLIGSYWEIVSSLASRYKLPASTKDICVAGVDGRRRLGGSSGDLVRERVAGSNFVMVPEYVALLSQKVAAIERIEFSDPGFFENEYSMTIVRSREQRGQLKAVYFRRVFVDGGGQNVYAKQSKSGGLIACLIPSRAKFIETEDRTIASDVAGVDFSNWVISGAHNALLGNAIKASGMGN